MALGLLKYHLLALWREPINLFFGFGLPILLLIMMPESDEGVNMVKMALPMIIMITATVLCFTDSALSHAYARQIKFLRRLRMTPVSSEQYIAMGMLSRYMVLTVFSTVIIGASAIFADVNIAVTNLLLFAAMLSLVFIMFYLMAMFTSNVLKNAKSSQGLIFVVFFGMLALGGMWFPVANMPEFLQRIARLMPTWFGGRLLEIAWQGGYFAEGALHSATVFSGHYFFAVLGTAAVFGLLSVKFFKFE